MPTHVGPNVLGEENLVFGYDLSDVVNSYRGEPTVNFVPGTYGYSTYAYVSSPVDTTVLNEKNKLITAKRYTITQSINVARAAIFPVGLTTGVSFTFSFKWKYNGSTTTSPSVGMDASKGNPEGGVNNNSFTSQSINTVNIGSGWYLSTYIFIFSSVPTGKCMLTFGIVTGSNSGYIGETFDIYEAQFEIKNHRTQFSNGVRSATQGLIDITGISTIDLSNTSFDSNAQMTFDGTDDFINLGDNSLFDFTNGIATIEAIIKFPSTWTAGSQYPNLISKGATSGWDTNGWALFGFRDWPSAGQKSWGFGIRNGAVNRITGRANSATDVFLHIVATIDGTTIRLYENGILYTTNSQIINPAENNTNVFIGRDAASQYFPGEIPHTRIYNRVLSSSEVLNNYNNIKRKYGI
jgi:hypothetical protein